MQKSAVAAYERTELQNLVIVLRRLVWVTLAIVVLKKKIAAGTGNCLRVPSRFIAEQSAHNQQLHRASSHALKREKFLSLAIIPQA